MPVDGRSHVVDVSSTRDVMLWSENGATRDCTLTDEASGAQLEATPSDGSFVRSDPAWDWVGVATFEPRSARVVVTCAGSLPTAVAVQPVPRVPAAVVGLSAWFLVPAGLALSGLTALAGAAVAAWRRRPGTT